MFGKLSLVLVLFISILIAYKISDIYIVEGFTNPGSYRLFYVASNLIAWTAKLACRLRIKPEYSAFRLLSGLFLKQLDSNQNVEVTTRFLNNVKTRIYLPKNFNDNSSIIIYVHGGAYFFGFLESYDHYLLEIAERVKIPILSIGYRLAPEYPYPTPTNDCWSVVEYVLENPNEFKINKNKLIFAGDSAGGNAALILSRRLYKEKNLTASLQILIYPWTQMFNLNLPSAIKYRDDRLFSDVTVGKVILWYLGITNFTREIENAINNNEHIYLIEDENLRSKYQKYFDINLITDKFKNNQTYYKNYTKYYKEPSNLQQINLLRNNKNLANQIKKIFNEDISPALADRETLKTSPKTYMIVVEWDCLKDENLIYAERLKAEGVQVEVAFYENAFHGMATLMDSKYHFDLLPIMLDNLIDYLKKNI